MSNKELIKELTELNTSQTIFKMHIKSKMTLNTFFISTQFIIILVSFISTFIFSPEVCSFIANTCITINFTILFVVLVNNIILDIIWKKSRKTLEKDLGMMSILDIFEEEE